MPDYHTFTSGRTTVPNVITLIAALRTALSDTTVGILRFEGVNGPTYRAKKATPWTSPQIATAQSTLDTAAVDTPQLQAQQVIDAMPIFEKAIVLTILDQFNLVRSKLVPPLPPITVQQMIDAIRVKAGTL